MKVCFKRFECGLRIANQKNMIYREKFSIKEDNLMKTTNNSLSNKINIKVAIEENSNLGLLETDCKKMSAGLSLLLADSYILYLKTHNYHWNVTGINFLSLHQLFMNQYTELALAVDKIAERIRALGFPAPATFMEFNELSSIKEETGVKTDLRMISSLNKSHEGIIRTIRYLLTIAISIKDHSTVDLLTQRLVVHEKSAWMLRSLLAT